MAVKTAFVQSISSALDRTDFLDLTYSRWGNHWIYRCVAEVMAAGTGTFVAAGLAPQREKVAAIIGGCTISAGFILKLLLVYLARGNTEFVPEPWYQYAIDFGMIIAAPAIGIYLLEAAEDMHHELPHGFGGINRLNFIWLWIPLYCYALGFISPITKFYSVQDQGIIATAIAFILNFIPVSALAIPAYYGLALLSGQHGNTMHPAGRNLVGALVLIFGFVVGAVIYMSWYFIVQKFFGLFS
jgi:hypothetical protein